MIRVLFLWSCLTLSAICQGQETDLGREDGALTVWRTMQQQPLQMVVAVKNDMADSTVYVGQPVLLNVGLRNAFAEELVGVTDEQMAGLKKSGLDFSSSSVELCAASTLWTTLVRIRMGVAKDQITWEGNFPVTGTRRMAVNRVDRNPISAMEYLVLDPDVSPGDYLLWAEFPRGGGREEPLMTNAESSLHSPPVLLHLRAPTNASEKAWVFAENGAMFARAHQYEDAEVWYKKALDEAPTLGRGPRIQGTRPFNVTWELVEVYEATLRHEDALRAVQQTREYVEKYSLPVREMIVEQVDARRLRIEKNVRQKAATTTTK